MISLSIIKEEPLYILNPQINSDLLEESLYEYLIQLATLTELGLNDGLPDYPKLFVHNYLGVIHHYVNHIKELIDAIFLRRNELIEKMD